MHANVELKKRETRRSKVSPVYSLNNMPKQTAHSDLVVSSQHSPSASKAPHRPSLLLLNCITEASLAVSLINYASYPNSSRSQFRCAAPRSHVHAVPHLYRHEQAPARCQTTHAQYDSRVSRKSKSNGRERNRHLKEFIESSDLSFRLQSSQQMSIQSDKMVFTTCHENLCFLPSRKTRIPSAPFCI
jgi:hypothetical protein